MQINITRKENEMATNKILLLISVICFILAVFDVSLGSVSLLPLGLAFGFGSMLV